MRNFERDGWSEQDWHELSEAASAALWAGRELDDMIGSGGGSCAPDQLDVVIAAMESALERVRKIRGNY